MAFQPCPNTLELRIVGTLYGQIVMNVLHARYTTAPDLTQMNAIADSFGDWVTGPYATAQSSDLGYSAVIITDLATSGGLQVTKDLTGLGGEISHPVKTNQDTFCVSLHTGHAGRSFRGRTYILAVSNDAYVDANTISDAFVALYVSIFETLITTLHDEVSIDLAVLSRVSGGVTRANGLSTVVTDVIATDKTVDSQNRRLPGRGR
jgi:hypothetical protein